MRDHQIISAVVIFYNSEKYLQEAIESVFAQTRNDWELLLVDDGSSDRSTSIALDYAEKDPERVRYIEHEGHSNCGAAAARNLGLSLARGRYVAFLDSDDVWLPGKLEEQVEILDANPRAGMVYGATRYWNSWTGSPEDADRDYTPSLGVKPDEVYDPPELLRLNLLSLAPTPCPSDILIRKEVAQQIGGFESDFHNIYQMFEDQAFFAKVYLNSPVYVSSHCWDNYRLHPDSCVSRVTNAGHKYTAGLYYLNFLEKYMKTNGVDDAGLWRAFARKKWRFTHPTLHRLKGRASEIVERVRAFRRSV